MTIFENKPIQWGFRGDTELWDELRKRFSTYNDPKNKSEFNKALDFEFNELLKRGKKFPNGIVWFKEFSQKGMSGGAISIKWWTDIGIPLLKQRYAKTLKT